jgi:diguanylate cyclase (GGDEF)-like protein
MRLWAWACGGHSVSWTLLYLQSYLPAFIGIVLANTISIAAVALNYEAITQFTNGTYRRSYVYALVVGVCASFLFFTYVSPNIIARHVVISFSTGIVFLFCAQALLHRHAAPRTVHGWLTGGWCLCVGIGALVRAISLLVYAPPTFSLFSSGLGQSVTYAVGAMSVLVGSIGFLLMCATRCETDLQQLATRDALTGSLNRGTIEQRLDAAWQQARRTGAPLSLVLLDIDHFKTINDTYGHHLGDVVLQRVVALVNHQLRSGDMVGRYGGEEFVLVLPNTPLDHAHVVAERVRSAIAHERFVVEGTFLHCTISGGVATSDPHDRTYTTLMQRADSALYVAKHQGRNCICAAVECASAPVVL